MEQQTTTNYGHELYKSWVQIISKRIERVNMAKKLTIELVILEEVEATKIWCDNMSRLKLLKTQSYMPAPSMWKYTITMYMNK